MNQYKLNEVEQKLIEKYQISNDQDIALYFFNKFGKDVLNIIYSKISVKFSSIPFEKEDLSAIVWKSLDKGLKLFDKNKMNWWSIWINNSYFNSLKEIQKYFKNTELVLNYADSLDAYQQKHLIYKTIKLSVEKPKESFKETLEPIIDFVVKNNKKYERENVKKLLYLKSLGYSEREIAKKMNVSRRYIRSMIKIVIRISKRFLSATNR